GPAAARAGGRSVGPGPGRGPRGWGSGLRGGGPVGGGGGARRGPAEAEDLPAPGWVVRGRRRGAGGRAGAAVPVGLRLHLRLPRRTRPPCRRAAEGGAPGPRRRAAAGPELGLLAASGQRVQPRAGRPDPRPPVQRLLSRTDRPLVLPDRTGPPDRAR